MQTLSPRLVTGNRMRMPSRWDSGLPAFRYQMPDADAGGGRLMLVSSAFAPQTLAGVGGYGIWNGSRNRSSIGDISPALQQLTLSAPSITAGALAAGVFGGSAKVWAASAAGPIGAAVAGVTVALMLLFGRRGPKQKRATTEIVKQVEPLLNENLQGYLSGPRTASSQQQAIENFYAGWQWVLDHCGIPEMGEPGRRCIEERQEGARPMWDVCAPDCPNWFELYLDPIRYDAEVRPDAPVPEPSRVIDGYWTVDPETGVQVWQPGPVPQQQPTPWPLLIAAGLALFAVVQK